MTSMVGRTVLITVGTGGIGRATALGLAAMGANVAITGRDGARAKDAAREIRAATGTQVEQEGPPGGIGVSRRRTRPPAPQDPPHGRFTDPVTEPNHLTVHPTVSPCRVLSRQAHDQVTDLHACAGTAGPIRVRPLSFQQATMPRQQGARRDEPMSAQPRRQQPGQRRQHRPIGPARLRPRHLTAQHRHLMPQHHDLNALGCLAPAQHHQPAEHPNHDHVEEAHRHKPRSSPHCPTTKPQVSHYATDIEAVHAHLRDYVNILAAAAAMGRDM
jgi:hypothetical protein